MTTSEPWRTKWARPSTAWECRRGVWLARLTIESVRLIPLTASVCASFRPNQFFLDPKLVSRYLAVVRIIAKKTLREFWEQPPYRDAEQPLKAWFKVVGAADWASPAAVRTDYGNANILEHNRVCFNIGGNKYRLVV